ncbi:hypothetical protein BDN71DRAFT_1055807 [Pleurotus eryngii]|uniref:Uncharacterized protein n=1 Tax=Pleurotus eryngii TaxID=5323 RepID=A0A9P6D7A3_PLEER|nr:hypothetical protein BDN71DRAFT_1055807 [Pleurotus eryngii]
MRGPMDICSRALLFSPQVWSTTAIRKFPGGASRPRGRRTKNRRSQSYLSELSDLFRLSAQRPLRYRSLSLRNLQETLEENEANLTFTATSSYYLYLMVNTFGEWDLLPAESWLVLGGYIERLLDVTEDAVRPGTSIQTLLVNISTDRHRLHGAFAVNVVTTIKSPVKHMDSSIRRSYLCSGTRQQCT